MITDDIAILIVTRCADGKVFKCIESIFNTLPKESISHINLYVKYTGNDESDINMINSSLMQRQSNYHVECGPYNFAKNINELARLGNEPVILCINDDIELVSDSITHCFDILSSNDRFGTVGIKLLFENNTIQHAGHLLLLKNNDFFQITHYLLKQPDQRIPDYVSVGNTFAFCMMRRTDFESCGGLNESYKKCFEDVEFNWKLLMRGKLHVTAGSTFAYHYESTTRKQQDCLIERDDVDELILFFQKNKNEILQNENVLERTIRRI